MTALASRGALAAAAVLPRLMELGPPSEIRAQAPGVAAAVLDFDRVLLSAVRDGELIPERLHGASAALDPIALRYPLAEAEIMRRRRAEVVDTSRHRGFGETLGWSEYVAAPIALDRRVIAFLHADRQPSGRSVDERDAADIEAFALCLALVYERAVLRHRLREQRQELRAIAAWAETRGAEIGDRAIELVEQHEEVEQRSAPDGRLRDLLTRREIEVLELMVRGETNAEIARELVLSEGTIKFHVKNILRKLRASNRAEATSRYLRLTLR